MKKTIISLSLFLVVFLQLGNSQSVKSVVPDSCYQGTNFPITITGDATEWSVSQYLEVYFDSLGVTANNVVKINDTLLTAIAHINGIAPLGWRRILVLDQFTNEYIKDSALKVMLSIPAIPVLILPPDNSFNVYQNPTLLWDSNYFAALFRVQIASDTLFNTIIYDTSVANTPLYLRLGVLNLGQKYFWRVNATNEKGTSSWSDIWRFTVRSTGIYEHTSENPLFYKLYNNFPNPFNPVTTIKFQVPNFDHVNIKVYNLLGQEISSLVNEDFTAGVYSLQWNAINLASGIYYIRFITNNYTDFIKVLLIK